MLKKVEILVDLLIRLLERELGVLELPAKREMRGRPKKAEPAAPIQHVEEADPFAGIGGDETRTEAKPTVEEAVEASRACIEIMGAFIKKHINDKPLSGQAQAKAIVQEVLGRPLDVKLDKLPYSVHLALKARFEQELEA